MGKDYIYDPKKMFSNSTAGVSPDWLQEWFKL
jgi:hypothetical protein